MDDTPNLKLPYILAAQSQKHVTHNEALRALDAIVQLAVKDKDLATPPGSPGNGDRYLVAASPTGAWAGHATHVAAWQDGAWTFYAPVAGWLAWVEDESQSYLFSGGGWIPAPGGGGTSIVPKGAWSSVSTYVVGDLVEHEGLAFLSNVDANIDNEPDAETPGSTAEWTYFAPVAGGGGGEGGSVNPTPLVGVNATADTTDRLKVSSPASLFDHEGAGHQLKINKDTTADTASVLFQTGYSGRAEFGLAGDDDFHVKVSPDGSVWHEALVINRSTGAVRGRTAGPAPGGRVTLQSGVPVMVTTQSAKTTIYYTPYQHRFVPLYDGTGFVPTDIGGELSQATTDTTKSPAAVASNSNYDLFVWNDGGTYRCTRGPAWSSGTSRGTGAGTTELERVAGVLVNKIAITNGPAAQRGTYVGTVRSNGSAQIDWIISGTGAMLGVWNAYNRVPASAQNFFTATRSTTSTSLVELNSEIRIGFVTGDVAMGLAAFEGYSAIGAAVGISAITLDGAGSSQASQAYSANQASPTGGPIAIATPGFHYVTLMAATSSGAVTFYYNSADAISAAYPSRIWFSMEV